MTCQTCILVSAAAGREGKLGYVMCSACVAAAQTQPLCTYCEGAHESPDALSDDQLRTLAEELLAGKVAWSQVCRPGVALAHGVLRLLER